MRSKYILSALIALVVVGFVILGTQTELLQGRIKLNTPKSVNKNQTFNITNVEFGTTLTPYWGSPELGIIGNGEDKKLNIDVSFQYQGGGNLEFESNYNWMVRCNNNAIDGFSSVLVTFPTGSAHASLRSGTVVSPTGELILTKDQLRKLKAGDGNLFCGFSYNKPQRTHNNVEYGFADKSIKKSYQIHIEDDDMVRID